MSSQTPYRIGPFDLEHPFILAPMAGITHSPFRRLMRRMGSACVISELVSANGIEHGGQKTLQLLSYHEEERPLGLQIFGETIEALVLASRKVESVGADFVDLNLGCPVPKIVKKGAGSAMCRNPAQLGSVLEAMVKAVKIPVTIKIRTGWDSESINAHEVVRVAAESGVSWVAIHGRTRAQAYSGLADWDLIGDVKAKSSIPILGNGDVNDAQTAVDRVKTYGLDGILIGRGALRNPFIFQQSDELLHGKSVQAKGPQDLLEVLRQLKTLLSESFPESHCGIHLRKFMSWYSSGYPHCTDFRKKVFSIHNSEELWEETEEFFYQAAQNRDLSFMSQPFLMGGHG